MAYPYKPSLSLRSGFVALTALGLFSGPAFAQTVPNAADVTKAASRFQEKPSGFTRSDPLTRESPELQVESKNQHFILGGVVLEGVSAYPLNRFSALYADKIGKNVSVEEIQSVASAIAAQYQADGYALAIAYLPTQTVDDGQKIVIRVAEGRVGKVEFHGEQPQDSLPDSLKSYIERIKHERPLTTDTLERYLLLINDLPGNTARAVLRPSTTDEDATDIVIYYAHKPLEAALTADNRGSRYLGPWQYMASATENAQLGMDERLTVRIITTSPTQELRYGDVLYEQAIGSEGTKLIVTGSKAQSRPGDTVKSLHAEGNSHYLQVKAIHPLLRSRLQNLLVRGAIDGRNTSTSTNGSELNEDRIRSLRMGASYDHADTLDGVTIVDTELSHGLSGLGATEDGAGRSRTAGEHDYTKITVDISRAQALPYDFSLLVAGSGQYAFTSLLAAEQYTLGGPAYGSAYDPGELSGDHGAAAKVELRYGQSLGDPLIESYQLYSYYDVGSVWIRRITGVEQKRESLASAGFGVRANLNARVSSNLEFAVPLTKSLGADRDNDGRIFAGIAVKY